MVEAAGADAGAWVEAWGVNREMERSAGSGSGAGGGVEGAGAGGYRWRGVRVGGKRVVIGKDKGVGVVCGK